MRPHEATNIVYGDRILGDAWRTIHHIPRNSQGFLLGVQSFLAPIHSATMVPQAKKLRNTSQFKTHNFLNLIVTATLLSPKVLTNTPAKPRM
jgi:hypothetical protein